LLKRFIVAASALALAAGCGAPATPISIRNAANVTAEPGTTPTNVALEATAVPATRPATEAATAAPTTDHMAGMNMGGTQAATQAAATTASSGTAGGAATATPFVLANVLFGTQAAATTVATAAPQTAAPTTIPPTTVPATPAPTVSAATAAPTTAAGTQAAPSSTGQGDPKHGQQIFTGVGTCSTCHDVAQGIQIVGPSLKGVATRAATRKPGMSASDYLHESIVNPNAYVVQGFVGGVMPQNFAQTLSAKDINDVVAYLLTLK
jgi:cytochrome c2